MRRFKLISGRHKLRYSPTTLEAGKVVATDLDMVAKFPGRFEETTDPADHIDLPADYNSVSRKNWYVSSPMNSDHEVVAGKIGLKISRAVQGIRIHTPTGVQVDENGHLWVANYYAQMHRINSDYEIDYTPNITYQGPAAGSGIGFL